MPSRSFVMLAVSASITIYSLQPGLAEAEIVDGFGVRILPLPTFDRCSYPESRSGTVKRYVGNNDGAVDPFYKIPELQGVSPYLAIYPNSSATYHFPPRNVLRFFWGTPDAINSIAFFNNGKLIGTLQGVDFQKAYGFSEGYRPFPVGQEDMVQIKSKVAFDTVVLSDTGHCCFEFSILRPRP